AGDGMYSVGLITDAGVAAENWYCTIAAPDTVDAAEAQEWVGRYKSKYGPSPTNYALTAYDGVLVIADVVTRLVNDGIEINRSNVRDYTQTTNLATLQGVINFDDNGDLKDKVVSIFQVKDAQFKYIGAGPQS